MDSAEFNIGRSSRNGKKTVKGSLFAESLIKVPKPPKPVTRKRVRSIDLYKPVKVSDTENFTCDASAKNWAVKLFGVETTRALLTRYNNIREVYEQSSPNTQCTNVLSGKPKKICWLCSYPLISGQLPPRSPKMTVCEHIFPIIQAAFFLDLYNHSNPGVATKRLLDLEYDWAHYECNSIKNDLSFIKERYVNSKLVGFDVNTENIDFMLNKISENTSTKVFRNNPIYKFDTTWKTAQLQRITTRIQNILDTEINNVGEGNIAMMLLVGVAKCYDENRMVGPAANITEIGEEGTEVAKTLANLNSALPDAKRQRTGSHRTLRKNPKKSRKNRKHK